MRATLTTYNSKTVGSGSVAGEVQVTYNDFGQITADYQAHGGSVNTSTTPKVQYDYASGAANTIRPRSLTYPDGRTLTYDYGAGDSMPDALSRIAAIVDDDGSSTHLADYSYLGLRSFVEVDYTEPDIRYTLVGVAGGNDPDTGDIYRGLDRFGRVKDCRWHNYNTTTDVDRIRYGYDRNGNRLWRENVVASEQYGKNFDELYGYDQIDRLQTMDRGDLTSLKDSIQNKTFAQDWALDPVGNWKNFREDDNGDSTWDLNQQRTANKVNEISNISESVGPAWVTPAYDRAGNMTTIPKPADPTIALTATYDPWNRLVKIEEPDGLGGTQKLAEYAYDGAKRRTVKKTYSGGSLDGTRTFFYTEPSQWQVVEERVDSSSDPDRQFIWGLRYIDDLTLRDRDTDADTTLDERLYALQDANWNVTALATASAAIAERYAYGAYGTVDTLTGAFATRAATLYQWETQLSGYRFDRESGLYCVRHRVFSPALGLWLQRDPIRHAERQLYVFVGGNPASRIDTTGQGWFVVVVGGVGLVFIGGVWIYKNDPPGSYDWLTQSEEAALNKIKNAMIKGLMNCPGTPPQATAIAEAIQSCPIVGKFEQGQSPDGADGTSLTYDAGWAWATKVILANDFFGRKNVCSQYFTLIKECYRRAHLRDFDDSGESDNRANGDFEGIECCLACCGHVNPAKWRKRGASCCPC